jgi:hypothetical protein
MAFDGLNTVDIIETMENYIDKIRPPKEIREKLDVNYKIENQSIILCEIRPVWRDKSQYQMHDYAKATFIKKNNHWKIYWLRATLKWNSYEPKKTVKKLSDFLKIVDEDKYGCFKG